jgi:hypothetical protein
MGIRRGFSVATSLDRVFDYVELQEDGPHVGNKKVKIKREGRVVAFSFCDVNEDGEMYTGLDELHSPRTILEGAVEYCVSDNEMRGKSGITKKTNGFKVVELKSNVIRRGLPLNDDYVIEGIKYMISLQFCKYDFNS